MRWRLLGLLLFAAAGAVAWTFWWRPQAEDWMKVRLESDLSRFLGQDVRVDAVRLHPLLLQAQIVHLRVGPAAGPLFVCDRWTFHTVFTADPSPFALLSFTLGRSDVDRPTFRVPPLPHPSRPLPEGWWRRFPLHRLNWRNGTFRFPGGADRAPLDLFETEGTLSLSPRGFFLDIEGDSVAGRFDVSLEGAEALRRGLHLSVHGKASVSNASLDFISPWLPAGSGRFLGRADLAAEGALDDFSVSSLAWEGFGSKVRWSFQSRFRDALWVPPDSRPKDSGVPLTGKLIARNERVDIEDLQLFKALNVSGSLGTDENGALDLVWRAKDLALTDLAESGFGFFRGVPSRGRMDSEGTVKGDRRHPDVAWTAELRDAGLPGFLLPTLEARGQWKDDWLALSVDGLGGRLDAEGTLRWRNAVMALPRDSSSAPGEIWTLRASRLDLGQLAQRNGWSRVGGLLNGSFSLVNTSSGTEVFRPGALGMLRIDEFAWGVHQETAPVQGHLTLKESGLQVEGAGGGFDLDIRQSSGVWRVERLAYEAGSLKVWGRGFLRDLEGKLQFQGGLEGLGLVDLPPVAKRFPSVEGQFSAEGRLHGAWDDPIFTGTVRLRNARWRPGGFLHSAEADLRGGRKGVSVSRFSWDDTLKAEGAWLFGQGWRFSAELDQARAEQAFDVFADSGALAGQFSGGVSLASGNGPGLEGSVRVSAGEGHWGTLPFKEARAVLYFRGERVDLESMEIRQGSGTLKARGDAARRALNPASPGAVWDWRLAGRAESLQAGAAVLSGSWTTRGLYRPREGAGEGDLTSPGFTLGVTSTTGGGGAFAPLGRRQSSKLGEEGGRAADGDLGRVGGKFFWSAGSLRLENVTSERGLRWAAEMAGEERRLSGRAEFRDFSLDALFPNQSRSSGARFGRLNGEAVLSGTWARPEVDLNVALSSAGWRSVDVTGDVRARWNGRLEIPRFSLRFPAGGTLMASGHWDPKPAGGGPAALWEGRLEGMSLDPILRSLGVPAPWNGTLEGTCSLSGSPGSLGGTLALEGKAQGPGDLPVQWRSHFRVEGATATLAEGVVTTAEGLWRIKSGSRVSRLVDGSWDVHLANDLRNIGLGPLRLFGGLSFDGQASPRERSLSGRFGARSLWINHRVFNQELADFRWSSGLVEFAPIAGARAFVKGRVRLDRWPQTFFENLTLWDEGRRTLVLSGELGPSLWDFSLQGWGLQAESLLSLADFDWPVTGPWDVRVRGRGSPSAPEVTADISGGPGRLGPVPYDRLETQAEWRGTHVDVQGVRVFRRKGYLLTGVGRLPIREGEPASDLELNLHLTEGKLAVLKDIWPLCRSAAGEFSGELRLAPGEGFPRALGAFHLRNGRLSLQTYAPRVTDLNAEVVFDNDRARVEHARARVGSGWIEMAGDIGIHGFSPVDYDLSIQSDGSRGVAVEVPQLSVPPGPLLGRFSFLSDKLQGISYGEPKVSLRLKGPHGEHRISGQVELEGTHFTYPPSKRDAPGPPLPRWWRNLWRLATWDIQFKTGKETWYRNEYVNVRLDGGLRLEVRPGAWAANGRVESREGAISYLGQTFQVKRGLFEILTDTRPGLGSAGILPFVAGEAERVVTSVDARGLSTDDTVSMIVDRALLGEIQPRFVSRNNPDMKSERVAMKALGLSSDQRTTQTERDQLLRAGLVQLVGSSAAPLANRLAQKFGIGMISATYEPPETTEPVPTAANPDPKPVGSANVSPVAAYLRGAGAAARIRLSERFFGVYKVKLDEAKNQTYFRDQLELVYRLKGSLYVRASTELDSKDLLGQPPERRAFLENQWRFGLPLKNRKNNAAKPIK
ncbi:MAG: translocation/assembly module TamB domain-containing protein [Elusimicrobia bacterium]|nr:translocation/assembly module TamB domain-containing protein [Elusimicrobiota bacterium]